MQFTMFWHTINHCTIISCEFIAVCMFLLEWRHKFFLDQHTHEQIGRRIYLASYIGKISLPVMVPTIHQV